MNKTMNGKGANDDWKTDKGLVLHKIEWLCRRMDTLDKRMWAVLVGVMLVLAKAILDLAGGA